MKLLLFFTGLCVSCTAIAQSYSIDRFCITAGGDKVEYANAAYETNDSVIIVAGRSFSFADFFADIYVTAINERGEMLWGSVIQGEAEDNAIGVLPTSDSTIWITGSTLTDYQYDLAVARLNPNGTMVSFSGWGNGLSNDAYCSVACANGFAIGGYTDTVYYNDHGDGAEIYLPMVTKFHNDGTPEWTTQFSACDSCTGVVRGMLSTDDGGFLVCGDVSTIGISGFAFGLADLFAARLSATGELLWFSRIGAEENIEYGNCIINGIDGGYLVAGFIYTDATAGNMYFVKFNEDGELQWEKMINNGGYDEAKGIITTTDNKYIVSGITTHFNYDYYWIQLSDDMQMEKTSVAGNELYDYNSGIIKTLDGNYFTYGSGTPDGESDEQMYLVEFNPEGGSCCKVDSGGSVVDYSSGQTDGFVQRQLHYTATGAAIQFFGGSSTAICRDSSWIADTIVQAVSLLPAPQKYLIYPNPASRHVRIQLAENVVGIAGIVISNVSGETVFTRYLPTSSDMELVLPDLAPGVYLLRISTGSGACSGTLVIAEH